MFIAQDQKDVCAFIKAHILKRPHLRSRFKHPSLNRRGGGWVNHWGGAGGRGKGGKSWRRCTATPSWHFRGAQAWRRHAFAARKLPRRAPGGMPRSADFFSPFSLKRAPFLFFKRKRAQMLCVCRQWSSDVPVMFLFIGTL
jgi:hypothetical protein